jgi:hypothetical protein
VRGGDIEWVSYFNKAAGRAHPRLAALPTTDQVVSYFRGTALGGPAASLIGKQINYDPVRTKEGALTVNVSAMSTPFGLQWGNSLTAGKRTDTGAANGTGVDFGTGSTSFGAQFFLHVYSFTGTSVTITVQSSSDNAVGDPFANVTGGVFATVSGITSERIATAAGATIERYLRVITAGTFSECTFAVVAVRNDTAVTF